ncbi:MAG: rhodanese-like domain-containing protein, partial [Pseudomonadota bacterium]
MTMARFGRLFLVTLLVLGLLFSTVVAVAGCGEETKTTGNGTATGTATAAQDNVIGDRALETLASIPTSGDYANATISAAKLSEKLAGADKATLFLVDIRSKADYDKGHIEGATQIDFKQWAASDNLAKLPKDKKIVVICYTGNTAAQTAMGMRMLGFDAIVLRAGMNGWTQTGMTQTVVNDLATTDNPVVTTPSTVQAKDAPAGGQELTKPSDSEYQTLAEKANSMMSKMPGDGEYANNTIAAAKLSEKLGNAAEKDKVFVVDIRSKADFDKGHIDGAVNIPYLSVAVPDNLKLLPKDKKVVVVCYTGNTAGQITTLLRM